MVAIFAQPSRFAHYLPASCHYGRSRNVIFTVFNHDEITVATQLLPTYTTFPAPAA